jgi:hypothetical protein
METILITGASAGIGKATAFEFAKHGKYKFILAARNEEKLQEIAKQIISMGSEAVVASTDLTKREDIDKLFSIIEKEGNKVDILINNAGLGFVKKIYELTDDEIANIVDVNMKAAFIVASKTSKLMVNQKSGRIVNISSVAGFISIPSWSIYCASKFALKSFSNSTRAELAPFGISVTSVHPGPIKTEFWERGHIKANEEAMTTVEKCAERIYWAAINRKRRVIIPRYYGVFEIIAKLFPGFADFLAGQIPY